MSSKSSVIVYAKRTPIGKLGGGLANIPAPHLAAALIKDAVTSTSIHPEKVDEVILGCVLPAGLGQAPARQAAIYGGLAQSVCATTINRVCGSGLKAIMLADQAIRSGDSEVIFAGGMENMSLAPHLLPNSRTGFKFGSVELKDHMQFDGLWDPYGQSAMGTFGEKCAKEFHFSREEQDRFAKESYERARRSMDSGHFAKEILPIEIESKKGKLLVDKDEEPFSVDLAKLSNLKPAFDKDGTVTAGNSSSINDGAALSVVLSEAKASVLGIKPLARILAQASFAQDPAWFTTAPIECIKQVLKKSNLSAEKIDQFEINEAFSVVTLAAIKSLNLDPAKVNPYGGAVALGHPIGASGARILATLINGLRATGKRYGLATLCIGGGEASAIVIEML